MKSLDQINKLLEGFEKKYGISVADSQQGSEAWFKLKLGVISASDASKVVAKKDSDTRFSYMCKLVAQVCTGVIEEINSKAMDWGNQHEDAARAHYEFSEHVSMTRLPFVFKDKTYREGCSPDGLVSSTKGAEIKCPFNTENFIKFADKNFIKPEYVWQCQFTLRVMEAEEWDFVQYDPRMKKNPMSIFSVKRDAEKQQKLDDMVPEFISDMDAMLARLGFKFGDQWEMNKQSGLISKKEIA